MRPLLVHCLQTLKLSLLNGIAEDGSNDLFVIPCSMKSTDQHVPLVSQTSLTHSWPLSRYFFHKLHHHLSGNTPRPPKNDYNWITNACFTYDGKNRWWVISTLQSSLQNLINAICELFSLGQMTTCKFLWSILSSLTSARCTWCEFIVIVDWWSLIPEFFARPLQLYFVLCKIVQ